MSLSSYATHGSYQDSGIDWIGSIPKHWQLSPIRANFAFRNEKNDPVITDNVLSLSIANGVTQYSEEGRGGNKRKDDLTAYKIARPDDIVLNSMNVIVGAIGRSKYFGAISPVYYALYAKSKQTNIDYFERVFSYPSLLKGLLRHGKGIMMKLSDTGQLNTIRMKISPLDLKNIQLPLPPPTEQRAIAAFLDDKCAKIDEAVRIKEAQIKLLRERRLILIQQAVTRGLDPNVPLKDSCIDWIGQIPAHWEVRSIRYAFKFRNNQRIPLSGPEREHKQGEYPYYGASGIIDHVDDYLFDEDLILIAEDGANLLSKSTPLAFVARGKYWVNNHAHILEPRFPGFEYWAELLSAADYTVYISGSAQPKLTRDRLASVRVPVPPSEEREKITELIKKQSAKFENAIQTKADQITKLKEYRTTLINAAVTGKIRVCEPQMV